MIGPITAKFGVKASPELRSLRLSDPKHRQPRLQLAWGAKRDTASTWLCVNVKLLFPDLSVYSLPKQMALNDMVGRRPLVEGGIFYRRCF